MSDPIKLAEEARGKGLIHLSISPIGNKPGSWQVAVRYTNSDGAYRVAIEEDLADAIRAAFDKPTLRAKPQVDRGLPPEVVEDDDSDINELI
jgi:hypothetical protein